MNPCEDDEKIYNFSYLKIFRDKDYNWKRAFCATKLREDIQEGRVNQRGIDKLLYEYQVQSENYHGKKTERDIFIYESLIKFSDSIKTIWQERNNQSATGTSTTVKNLKF